MPDAGRPQPAPSAPPQPPAGRLLRLVLMGTGPFAVPSFEALAAAGHTIALVVTRPQPPARGRRGAPESPVRQWAERRSLPLFDPPSINDADAVARVGQAQPDLLVVCDYGQILRPAALETARLGGINLHGSLLPAYRGAAPVQWAVRCGEAVTGASVIHMTPRLDGGPVLATRQTEIGARETAGELEQRLAVLGVDAVLESVRLLCQWDGHAAIGRPQDDRISSQAPRLQKQQGRIDWSATGRQIDCHVRAMQPWPTAFAELVEADRPATRLAVLDVTPLGETGAGAAVAQSPGDIVTDGGLCVACGDGWVRLNRLQPAGRRAMSAEEFLRGRPMSSSAKLL